MIQFWIGTRFVNQKKKETSSLELPILIKNLVGSKQMEKVIILLKTLTNLPNIYGRSFLQKQ